MIIAHRQTERQTGEIMFPRNVAQYIFSEIIIS